MASEAEETLMRIPRRIFLRGLMAAPAIVTASNIMPVRAIEWLTAAPYTDELIVAFRHFEWVLIPIECV